MINENEEELIKKLFIDKITNSKKSKNIFASKIFEEYVNCKNAVNIYLQANGVESSINTKKYQKKVILL